MHRPICLVTKAISQQGLTSELKPVDTSVGSLLCEPRVDVGVDFGQTPGRMDRDGGRLLVAELGECRHLCRTGRLPIRALKDLVTSSRKEPLRAWRMD